MFGDWLSNKGGGIGSLIGNGGGGPKTWRGSMIFGFKNIFFK